MSTYYNLLSIVKTTIEGLNLDGIDNANIVIKKLPAVEQKVDTLPMILVVPSDQPEDVKRFTFEKEVSITYRIEVVIVAAGNLDMSSTNLSTYLDWRQKIRKIFHQAPLNTLGVPSSVWDIAVQPLQPLDRRLVNQSYDYQGLAVLFRSVENQDE